MCPQKIKQDNSLFLYKYWPLAEFFHRSLDTLEVDIVGYPMSQLNLDHIDIFHYKPLKKCGFKISTYLIVIMNYQIAE